MVSGYQNSVRGPV